jgi:hypothetical protein
MIVDVQGRLLGGTKVLLDHESATWCQDVWLDRPTVAHALRVDGTREVSTDIGVDPSRRNIPSGGVIVHSPNR